MRSPDAIANHIRTFCNPPLSLVPMLIEIEESGSEQALLEARSDGFSSGYEQAEEEFSDKLETIMDGMSLPEVVRDKLRKCFEG